jgi:hypothetical protein
MIIGNNTPDNLKITYSTVLELSTLVITSGIKDPSKKEYHMEQGLLIFFYHFSTYHKQNSEQITG